MKTVFIVKFAIEIVFSIYLAYLELEMLLQRRDCFHLRGYHSPYRGYQCHDPQEYIRVVHLAIGVKAEWQPPGDDSLNWKGSRGHPRGD
jgi:hypothetical protein